MTYSNVVIDISHYQTTQIDFEKVKSDGIMAVIHKATQGLSYVDPRYTDRREKAERAGLLWGAYHFGTAGQGALQARHFLTTVNNISNVLLVIDLEINKSSKNTITQKDAEDFINYIWKETSRKVVVYGSRTFLDQFAKSTIITNCSLWIASYAKVDRPLLPAGWINWRLWQYTNGTAGNPPTSVISIGPCDRDKFNGTIEEFQQFWQTSTLSAVKCLELSADILASISEITT